NIEFTSNKNGHLIMNFYNSLGKTVLTKEMHSIIGNNHEKIKLDQLEAGIYYIQICSEEGNLFRKVLIN
ncbi:MAG: T9SS type A sorting domain-containing protein, partial [Bacteroidales bacterium]|nr:T9SS type A sorting domain-containing protein [Bacteroidales bacterium]